MKNCISISDKCQLDKNQIFCKLFESINHINLSELEFVSCFYNTISTRILCPKCKLSHTKSRSKVFMTTKSLSYHLTKSHSEDAMDFPTLKESLKFVEIHSVLLQLRLVGIWNTYSIVMTQTLKNSRFSLILVL